MFVVAVVFAFALFVWDSGWPYKLAEPVDPHATLVMTIVTLFVGIALVMLARLGAESDRQ